MKNAKRIGVYGASGSGKSTLGKAMMHDFARVVVFDPMDEYAAGGFKRVQSLPAVLRAIKSSPKRFRIAYVPPSNREALALHQLSRLLRDVQAGYRRGVSRAQVMLAVEELNLSFPVTSLPQELWGFSEVCSRGRHYGINILGITQRPAEVNTRFRGNLEEQYIFRLAEHRDLQAVSQIVGPEAKERARALQVHEYLHFANGELSEGKNRLN